MSEPKKESKGVVVKLVCVRMSFAHLFEKDQYKRYSANFLFDPDSDADKAVRAAVNKAATNMWGPDAAAKLKVFKAKDEICYRDGNSKLTPDGDVYTGYEGKKVLTATASVQPTLLNELREQVKADAGKLYSGCYVTAIVEIWPQNGPKYYGIRCQLQGVQHFKDGESFGGGRKASPDEFDDAPLNPDDAAGGDEDGLL